MSRFLSVAAISSFDAQVKNAYAMGSKLRPTVRVKTDIVGTTHRFPKMGKGLATPRIPQSDVIPMGIAHTNSTATLTNWNAPEYTDVFDEQGTNVNERAQLATIIAQAIGRREDQLIIDAMDAAGAILVDQNVGGTNTNMNTAKARKAKAIMDAYGVPKGDRYMLIHANGLNNGMLADTAATSSDFNAVKALVQGEIDTWLGFRWIDLEDRDEGGLALGSNLRTSFAYHGGSMGAVGLAVGIDFRTEVNYIPEKTSWLANGLFSAGAVAIDAQGIVEMNPYEA